MSEYDTVRCPVCRKMHDGHLQHASGVLKFNGEREDHEALNLCGRCADIAGMALRYACSGSIDRWSRWKNPHPPSRPAYQKQPISEALRWDVFTRDGMKCKACGSTKFLRADHIVPESQGGPTHLDNLQTLCATCNGAKGARRVSLVPRVRRSDHGVS